MKRNDELRYLLVVFLAVSLGFLLLSASHADRNIPSTIATRDGVLDISSCSITAFPNFLLPLFFAVSFLLLHVFVRMRIPGADPLILPLIALLTGIGLIMLFRLSPDLAIARNNAILSLVEHHPDIQIRNNVLTLSQLGIKQYGSIIIGILTTIAVISALSGRVFSKIASKKYLWVLLSFFLIVATMVFGNKINGKRLWLFGFQTVELVKVLVILFVAGYFYEKGKGINSSGQSGFRSWFQYAGPFVAMCLFALMPILIQGDLGPTFLLLTVFLLLFYYAGNRNLVTLLFIFLVALGGYVSYKTGYPHIVKDRFDMLFDPFGRSENMARVLWSISSGGIWGAGIGYGQPYRIPEVQSDFNFAAICEEIGLIGAVSLVLAYSIFVLRCFRIAANTTNIYKKTLIMGTAVLVGVQAFIIIAGNLNSIPMTGITLPFVSYGGSSMVMNFLLSGIVLKISGDKA